MNAYQRRKVRRRTAYFDSEVMVNLSGQMAVSFRNVQGAMQTKVIPAFDKLLMAGVCRKFWGIK